MAPPQTCPQVVRLRICVSGKGGAARHGGLRLLVTGPTRHSRLLGRNGVSVSNGCWDSALSSKLPVLAEPGGWNILGAVSPEKG